MFSSKDNGDGSIFSNKIKNSPKDKRLYPISEGFQITTREAKKIISPLVSC